eukprot:TRINITY_DN1259_c0_g1_i1.p1 TRINITY_DN1259_c0_g1~~TRINITY_DN1259_c0_g1_i1.p1  ORF type:complete len:771 (-),score=300.34 TRINITY_DN1259_c0_g1_i1:46-2358(-)
MSAGIDFGNRSSVISVVRRGGVDVVVNEVNLRQTSTIIGFTDKERDIGESGATKFLRNPQNTISHIKRLIGRKFSEADVQAEIPFLSFKIKALEDDEIGIEVSYRGQKQTFTPLEALAMILRKLRSITEVGTLTQTIRDVVLSVPVFFTSVQRQAYYDAARVAGLNPLRLINETTSTALAYGFFRTDFSDKDPHHVMFVDMGDSSFTVSVVAFYNKRLKVLSHAFDRNLGARNFDRVLVDYFANEFNTKYKLDIKSNARARARLEVACERVKKVLSANIEAPLAVECIMNDTDVKGMVSREQFEKLAAPLLSKIAAPIQRALQLAGLELSQIASVELVGGGTRIPSVLNKVSEVIGKPISRTLNAEESCSKGCALQGAILSPSFGKADYKIEEYNVYPIEVIFSEVGAGSGAGGEATEVIARGAVIPVSKMVTYPQGRPFEMIARYSADQDLAPGTRIDLGRFKVNEVPLSKSGETLKARVKVRVNLHGIFGVESASVSETIEAPPAAEGKMEEDAKAADSPATGDKMETSEDEKKKEENTKKEQSAPAAGKDAKKPAAAAAPAGPKVVKTELKIDPRVPGLAPLEINKLQLEEEKRVKADAEVYETAELKNTVESYIYETRNSLEKYGELDEHSSDAEKEAIRKVLEQVKEWLYGEGEYGTKEQYQGKMAEMKKVTGPVEDRRKEQLRKEEEERKRIEDEKKKAEQEKKRKAEEEKKKKADEEKERKRQEEEKKKKEEDEKKVGAEKSGEPSTNAPSDKMDVDEKEKGN